MHIEQIIFFIFFYFSAAFSNFFYKSETITTFYSHFFIAYILAHTHNFLRVFLCWMLRWDCPGLDGFGMGVDGDEYGEFIRDTLGNYHGTISGKFRESQRTPLGIYQGNHYLSLEGILGEFMENLVWNLLEIPWEMKVLTREVTIR